MNKDFDQIKHTVLPEGVRRLTKLIAIVAAILLFLVMAATARDGWLLGLFLGAGVYYLIPLVAKAIFWIKNGF